LDLDPPQERVIDLADPSRITGPLGRARLAFSGDGESLSVIAVGYSTSPISKVWRPGETTAVDLPLPPQGGWIPFDMQQLVLSKSVLSADSRFLAGFDVSGSPGVRDLLAPKKAEALRMRDFDPLPHYDSPSALGLSPDGKHLMLARKDLGVKLWDLQSNAGKAVPSGEASFPWQKPQDPVTFPGATEDTTPKSNEYFRIDSLACTNDGTLLAAASRGVIWVWERKNDQPFTPLIALRGHTGIGPVLVFTPDGQSLVSGSDDSTVRVWYLKPKPKLDAFVPLLGHKGPITSASISPDGRLLLTTSLDGTARVWTLDRETLLRLAGDMTREPEDSRVKRSSRY
jgi:WD40 repeat protein